MHDELSLPDFARRFSSEEACLNAIFNARWPNGFICPKCGHNDGYRLNRRRIVQCTSCRRQSSITAGTLFHRTKIPLTCWFWIIFLVTQDKGSASCARIASLLRMHYTTVWTTLHKIRTAMASRDKDKLLAGTVEVDDAFFGRAPRSRRRGRSRFGKKQVMIMVERSGKFAGHAFMRVIHNAFGYSFRAAVQSRVKPDQHIRTDGHLSFMFLHGFAKILDNSPVPKHLQDKELRNANLVISLAKRYLLGTYHQYCSRRHLQRYLNEFCWRFNRRHSWYQLASRLLSACASNPPVLYAALS
jgi:transposase-like protein